MFAHPFINGVKKLIWKTFLHLIKYVCLKSVFFSPNYDWITFIMNAKYVKCNDFHGWMVHLFYWQNV